MLGQNQAFFYKGQKYKRQKSKREPLLNPDTLRCIKIDESGSYAGTVFLHWKTIVKFRSGEFYVPEGWYVIEDDNRMHSVVSPRPIRRHPTPQGGVRAKGMAPREDTSRVQAPPHRAPPCHAAHQEAAALQEPHGDRPSLFPRPRPPLLGLF